MMVFDPPVALRDLLVEGTRALSLELAGWDFKIENGDTYWCLEANPMPGFSPYDNLCDGAISRAVLRHLGAELPDL
jgi:D-alanine-D-alanine ligase-like ATP-grasp enzyme